MEDRSVECLHDIHSELSEMNQLLKAKATAIAERELELQSQMERTRRELLLFAEQKAAEKEKALSLRYEGQLARLEMARGKFQRVLESSQTECERLREMYAAAVEERDRALESAQSQREAVKRLQKKLRVQKWQLERGSKDGEGAAGESSGGSAAPASRARVRSAPRPGRSAARPEAAAAPREIVDLVFLLLEVLDSSPLSKSFPEAEGRHLQRLIPGICRVLEGGPAPGAVVRRPFPQQQALLRLLLLATQGVSPEGSADQSGERPLGREAAPIGSAGVPDSARGRGGSGGSGVSHPRQHLLPYLSRVPEAVGAGPRGPRRSPRRAGAPAADADAPAAAADPSPAVGGLLASGSSDVSVCAALVVLRLSSCAGQKGAAVAALRVQSARAEGKRAMLCARVGPACVSELLRLSAARGGRLPALACGALLNLSQSGPSMERFLRLLSGPAARFPALFDRVLSLPNLDRLYGAAVEPRARTRRHNSNEKARGVDERLQAAVEEWRQGDRGGSAPFSRAGGDSLAEVCTAYGVLLQRCASDAKNAALLLAADRDMGLKVTHLVKALSVHTDARRRAGLPTEQPAFLLANLKSAVRNLQGAGA